MNNYIAFSYWFIKHFVHFKINDTVFSQTSLNCRMSLVAYMIFLFCFKGQANLFVKPL